MAKSIRDVAFHIAENMVGKVLSIDEFISFLVKERLLYEPIDELDELAHKGFRNVEYPRIKNELNSIGEITTPGFRIDTHIHGRTVIVRNLADALEQDANFYLKRIAKQLQNKNKEAARKVKSARQDQFSNEEKNMLESKYKEINFGIKMLLRAIDGLDDLEDD